MPGFSLLFSKNDIDKQAAENFSAVLRKMQFFESYESEILYRGKNILLGFSGYTKYPVSRHKFGRHLCFVEGKIYSHSENEILRVLELLSKDAFEKNGSDSELVDSFRRTLPGLDGEFCVIIIDEPNQKVVVVNDALGKLPLYYHVSSDAVTISREISFVRNLNNANKYDRFGAAQFLMYRYSFGQRTVFAGITRFPSASFLRIGTEDISKEPVNYKKWDICESIENGSIEVFTEKLLDMARQAVISRNAANDFGRAIIALSGGLDSRSVFGLLKTADVDMVAASSIDFDRNNLHDVEIAEKTADSQNVDFIRIELKKPGFSDFEQIAAMKPGLNNVIMANALGLYDTLSHMFPLGTDFYTGDGGASMKTPYRVHSNANSEDQILNRIFRTPAIFEERDLRNLLGIGISELIEDFKDEIEKYSPDSWREKYFHYIVFDYLTNFGYEGQDRSRYFFWTQTPFESIPFYIYALGIPDRFKTGLKLINSFLRTCNPSLLDLEYADYRGRPDSVKVRMALKAKNFAKDHPGLLQRIRKIIHPHSYGVRAIEPDLLGYAMDHVEHLSSLPAIADIGYLRKLLENPINRTRFFSLLSLVLTDRKMQ